jgi:hypothetical protein
MTCRHRHWTITPTGSRVCVGCGADIGPRPLAGEWICEQHPDKPWPHGDCPGPGMPTRRSRGTSSERPLSRWADARVSLSGSVPRSPARFSASSGARITTWPTRHPPCYPGAGQLSMAFDAAARIEAASTSTRLSGIPYLGQSQTNATGPGGGSGQTQNSCRDWHPPPCPPPGTRRMSLEGSGSSLSAAGIATTVRRTSCRGCSPCARRRTRRRSEATRPAGAHARRGAIRRPAHRTSTPS